MGCVGHFQLDLLAQVVCVRERMGVDQGHSGDRSDAHRGMGVLSFTQGKGADDFRQLSTFDPQRERALRGYLLDGSLPICSLVSASPSEMPPTQ